MAFRVGRNIFFPVPPSVPLSVTNRVLSITWNRLSYIHETLYKYQPTGVNVQSARIVTLSFILFELFPLELCPSQKQLSMTILYQIMIVQ